MPTLETIAHDEHPRRATDFRDLALEHAAVDHVELQARVTDLEAERDTYRELLLAALAMEYDLTTELRRANRRLAVISRQQQATDKLAA